MSATTPANRSTSAWTRRDTLVLAAIVVACGASLAWLSHPWFEASNDAAIYVQTARAMLAGGGYSYLGEPFVIRPPGFSALLAPVIALRGVDFGALNLYVGLWGVLCAALVYVWLRTRVSTLVAAALTATLWLAPGFQSLRNQVMSDVPGTALLFACLLLERWSARKPSIARDVVLGAAIAIATYVRSMTILLVPAIALARLATKPANGASRWKPALRSIVAMTLAAVLVQLPWSLRNAAHHPEPPVDQTSLYDYSTGMWNADRGDPASERLPLAKVIERVAPHALATLVVLGSRMQANAPDATNVTLGALFVLALAANAWRKRDPAELFALASIALVLPYFSFQDRLLLPALVVAWASSAELLEVLARRVAGTRAAELAPFAAVLALLVVDFHPRANWTEVEAEHERTKAWCARLAPLLPADARVAVPMESWRYSIYLDRPVWTLFFGWKRAGGPAGAERVIDRRHVDTVVLTPFTASDAEMAPYFVQRYGTTHREDDLVVVRVR